MWGTAWNSRNLPAYLVGGRMLLCLESEPCSFFGRGERIRTSGLCVPNAALYRAEPHPDCDLITAEFCVIFN